MPPLPGTPVYLMLLSNGWQNEKEQLT